jgi:hypothetical protein
MVEAGEEVAGWAALLPDAEAKASDAMELPAAASPSGGLTGGTCNCKSSTNYKGTRVDSGVVRRGLADGFIGPAFGLC